MKTNGTKIAQSTDVMHRRVSLPLSDTFQWEEIHVAIRTNSQTLLDAAHDAGLARSEYESPLALLWEIVAERGNIDVRGNMVCRMMRNGGTIYLDMGPRQWFAFDQETGNAAGFIAVPASGEEAEAHAVEYLRAVTASIRTALTEKEHEEQR